MAMPEGLDIILSRLIKRSVAGSRPANSLQISSKVVVTVQLDRLHKHLSITSKSISLNKWSIATGTSFHMSTVKGDVLTAQI